ncbi:hypothetical protein HD806DRAFT_540852 [Xylariaceae sp. AK1471]|nr:hypothetical protein HD806DRAFT_540852 [Xylariaceae sp. AK1471]
MSHQRHGTAQATFHPFPRLPTELRWGILEKVEPRIIRLDLSGKYRDRDRGCTMTIDGLVREQVSPLLLVNREARYVAMKDGLICFTVNENDTPRVPRHFAIARQDIVFVSGGNHHQLLDLQGYGDTDKIVNIMIGAEVRRLLGTNGPIHSNNNAFLKMGEAIVHAFRNREALERLLCLAHNSRSSTLRKFEMSDLEPFSPDQFPRYYDGLVTFLHDFNQERAPPQPNNALAMHFHNRSILLKQVLLTRKK